MVPESPGSSSSHEEIRQWFADHFGRELGTMPPSEPMASITHLASGFPTWGWEEDPKDPLVLADPPEQPLRYTLKVTLDGSKPPIWRRISVPSDVTLDQFHQVLQAGMGWTNSHLHQFTPGHDRSGRHTEKILTDWDISEGDEGRPETTIRLDAMVTRPGDKLHYWYDFGDSWHHTVVLEKAEPRAADDDRAGCLAGRRACPPEDIGGVHFYSSLFDAAEDSDHPDHVWAREVVDHWQLSREDAETFDLDDHDAAVRRAMAGDKALRRILADPDAYPIAIADLFSGTGHDAALYVAGFVDAANVLEPVGIDSDSALAATSVIRTFLDHVSVDGVALTAAGYLKPASVVALMAELDPDHEWIGKATTEAQTQPLRTLREVLTGMGLVRKLRGRLLLTKAGAKLRQDPVGLWWHVARRLPVERPNEGRDAATFILLHLAAGGRVNPSLHETLDMFMAVRGWALSHELPSRTSSAWRYYTRRTEEVLRWAASGRVFSFVGEEGLSSPAARLLARGSMSSVRPRDGAKDS